MTNGNPLYHFIDKEKMALVELLRELVMRSQHGEDAIQSFVAERLDGLGFKVDLLTYDLSDLETDYELSPQGLHSRELRTAVVAQSKGSEAGRSILLFAHPDTEPIAHTHKWTRQPFAGEVHDGRMYGWGVGDDLVGVATMLATAQVIVGARQLASSALLLASTPSKRQARGIVAVLQRGYRADASLYLHPAESGHGLKDLKAVTPGLLRFKITVQGRPPDTREPVHTPFHHLAEDSFEKALSIVEALRALGERRAREVVHPTLEAAIGRSTNIHIAHVALGSDSVPSRVPADCTLVGSISFPPGEEMRDVQEQLVRAVAAAAEADDWLRSTPPTVKWLFGSNGAEVPLDHDYLRAASSAVGEVTGEPPSVYSLHSVSDIRHPILYAGIPTIGMGSLAGNLTQAGNTDEWADVEDYLRAIKVTCALVSSWCQG